MRILLLFVDGIGLGDADTTINPFAYAKMPTLTALTNGHRWLASTPKQENERATFIPTDPAMGIAGRPQSGSSQAAIMTGKNIPEIIGRHYGPKPDAETRALIAEDNVFKALRAVGKQTALIDGYPPRFLKSIARGKTLPSSIQQAAIESGQSLFTTEDIIAQRALTAEWTGDEWHSHLKIVEVPIYSPFDAGVTLGKIAQAYDFAMHSHWLTDYIGHRGPMDMAVQLLERFDGVIEGLLSVWDIENDLILITSDHGNMEVIGNRMHTENRVPTLVIGDKWRDFAIGFENLSHFYERIMTLVG